MTKKDDKKLSLQEYINAKAKQQKKLFRFYPWPVTAALLIPLIVFFMLIILYFINIKQATG